MKIYMIRHGETDFNRQGIVQGGGVDSDLNDLGHKQANAFFDHYKAVAFDAVYVSPLKRTQQTVRRFVDELGHLPQVEAGLIELSWGILEGKVPSPSEHAEFNQLKSDWQKGMSDLRVVGGESPEECWNRLTPVLNKFKSCHRNETILVCTHGRTSRVLLSKISTGGFAEMEKFNHTNTGLNILSLNQKDQWIAEKLNDTQHLESFEGKS